MQLATMTPRHGLESRAQSSASMCGVVGIAA
jgi:hypothetical protein